MVLNRKFIIWLVSFGAVLAAFLLYRSTGGSGVVEVTRLDRGIGGMDANQYVADSNPGQVGQAKLEYLEKARFETVDAKTRKLKRVVGFEKVLHKTGNEWVLDKPYMNVFQDNLRYDITADTGTVELENVEGTNPAPKSAVLKGNVVVHILPKMTASESDSFVYLNQVTFDSDRSMFSSDDDVNFVSAEAHLFGKGLEIVYNSITNKLEHLKIKKVDFLNITKLAQAGQMKEKRPQESAVKESAEETAGTKAKGNQESFQCLFRDNVVLEYEKEVVLSSEIAITNIMSSSSEQPDRPQSADVNAAGQTPPKERKKTTIASLNDKEKIVATVKCDGPMIIRPMSADKTDDYRPPAFRNFLSLPADTLRWLGKRNVLLAQRVSYDYTSQVAKAHGQVELVFYPAAGSYTKQKETPFIVNAKDGAEFISKANQVIFCGDVKGNFSKQTDSYNEENTFHGDKLVVDLTSGKDKSQVAGPTNISHITITGPGVKLESVRTAGGTKLSHVRLKSEKIDYDKATEEVVATGKGIIEYRSTANGNSQAASSKGAFDRPCYAIVEGFDKLVWDTNALQVKAFSDKTKGVHLGYLPIEHSGYGNRITVDTRQVEIEYFEPTAGNAQLKQLYATGGIVYYEQPKYEFVGKDLYYDAQKQFLTVSGSQDMPCMLNGVMADAIEYDLNTGTANAVLGSGVGIMPVKK